MRSRLELATPRLHVPLARVALCADCEVCFEIGPDTCPACGGETWSTLSRFLGHATDGAVVRAVRAVVAETRCADPDRRGTHHLVIVSREQPKLFEMLRRELQDNAAVTVISDRRGRRGPSALTRLPDQRWRNVDRQIAALGWAIVRADRAVNGKR
ncbi:MAG TPA: hypothetical protein VGR82_02410 [Methylomirabilota bacterium]|jgi:hypothetical protein|nr:hypothetical protein [Methylomirabilota bacterium]